jgi:hypothetical protein
VDAPLAYFGLGESFDRKRLVLRVTWDDGTVSEHHGVPANRRIVITEGKEAFGVAKLSGRSR